MYSFATGVVCFFSLRTDDNVVHDYHQGILLILRQRTTSNEPNRLI